MQLEGTPNFRDLGGLECQDGRTVRHGLLYRSEAPTHLTDEDKAKLTSLEIRLVCDLRSESEGRRNGESYAPFTQRILNLDINEDLRAEGNHAFDIIRQARTIEAARDAVRSNYRSMVDVVGRHLNVLVDQIIGGELPMMIHCAAGKDRTGVVVAVLLSALDVQVAEIYRDYERSDDSHISGRYNDFKQRMTKLLGCELGEGLLLGLMATDSSYLTAAFDQINARWGSLGAYLQKEVGLSREKRIALQGLLLQGP